MDTRHNVEIASVGVGEENSAGVWALSQTQKVEAAVIFEAKPPWACAACWTSR